MPDLPPFLLSRDRLLHGLTPNELAKRVKSGALIRIRHGVYVDGVAWRAMKPWEQYRLRVQAAAETFEKPTVFVRHSSASLWGISTVGLHHPVQALTFKNDGGRSRAGLSRYYASRAGLNMVRREGLLVTDRIRTVLDLAAFTPFAEAVVPMDRKSLHGCFVSGWQSGAVTRLTCDPPMDLPSNKAVRSALSWICPP